MIKDIREFNKSKQDKEILRLNALNNWLNEFSKKNINILDTSIVYKEQKNKIYTFVSEQLIKVLENDLSLDIRINPYLKQSISYIKNSKLNENITFLIKDCKIALNLELRISEIGLDKNFILTTDNINKNKHELINQYFITTLINLLDFKRSNIKYKNLDILLTNLSMILIVLNGKINFKILENIIENIM